MRSGCFADQYDWRDGIGPHAQRPVRTNFWVGEKSPANARKEGPERYDPNAFAFFRRLAGEREPLNVR